MRGAKRRLLDGVQAIDRFSDSLRAEPITGLGGSDVVGHVAHDGSKLVAVSANVSDVDAVMAALGSPPPELAAAMEKHGLLPPLVAYVEG